MTDRKKPGVAFWATVVVVGMLVAYPVSWGPVTWITIKTGIARCDGVLTVEGYVYAPLFRALHYAPPPIVDLWNTHHKWWVRAALR